jgi:hypothetical protein
MRRLRRHAWLRGACLLGLWAWRAWALAHWLHWPL